MRHEIRLTEGDRAGYRDMAQAAHAALAHSSEGLLHRVAAFLRDPDQRTDFDLADELAEELEEAFCLGEYPPPCCTYPGMIVSPVDGEDPGNGVRVQRCDTCGLYNTDMIAASAYARSLGLGEECVDACVIPPGASQR